MMADKINQIGRNLNICNREKRNRMNLDMEESKSG